MNIRRWLSRRLMDTVNPEVNAAFGGEIALEVVPFSGTAWRLG